PSKPKQPCAQQYERNVGGWEAIFTEMSITFFEIDGTCQSSPTCRHMNDCSSCKIKYPHFSQNTISMPGHMREGCVDDNTEKDDKRERRTEGRTFSHSSGDRSRSDNRKFQLKQCQ